MLNGHDDAERERVEYPYFWKLLQHEQYSKIQGANHKRFHPIHEAQLLTYLRLCGWQAGLLINFNVPLLKQGIKRLVHNYDG